MSNLYGWEKEYMPSWIRSNVSGPVDEARMGALHTWRSRGYLRMGEDSAAAVLRTMMLDPPMRFLCTICSQDMDGPV